MSTSQVQRERNAPKTRRIIVRVVGVSFLLLVLCLAAFGALFIWGLEGGSPIGEGDPGGLRLNELSSDPIFAVLPEGATEVRITKTPAKYRDPGFEPARWDGPGVELRFKSVAPVSEVYTFYAEHAAAAGWHPTGTSVVTAGLRLTDKWQKAYPDGAAASLILFDESPPTGAIGEHLFILGAGIAPAAWR